MNNQKIAVVTGSSSGIGLETSLYLAKNGFKTYATMRNLSKAENIKQRIDDENLPVEILQLDVTDDTSVRNAINKIVEEEGRIDVLVNNAGYVLIGASEDLSSDEIKAVFDTNVFGVFRTTQAVLPTMRKQNRGRIITISSLSGFAGFPAISAYVSTKHAIEGFTESLRYEVSPFGINASVVEPGIIKTQAIERAITAKKTKENSPYSDVVKTITKGIESVMRKKGSPASVVAEAVLKAATEENPEIRYPAGEDAKMLLQARKNKSDKEFEEFIQSDYLSSN